MESHYKLALSFQPLPCSFTLIIFVFASFTLMMMPVVLPWTPASAASKQIWLFLLLPFMFSSLLSEIPPLLLGKLT